MSLAWFPIALLGVWRITHLLVAEEGPGAVLARLRKATRGEWWETFLDCFYCVSVWVAIPFALLLADGWVERFMLWPGLSGGAIIIDRLAANATNATSADYVEHAPETNEGRRDLLSR